MEKQAFMKNPQRLVEKCANAKAPVFVLCGTDECAIETLQAYYKLAYEKGCDRSFLNDLQLLMKEFERFAMAEPERVKLPD